MEDLLKVGVITSTHGLKGEVKVYPTTDDPKRFLQLKEILLDTGKEKNVLHITNVKFFKNMVILKFKEYNEINEVEPLRQKELFVTRENAVPLEENEYYIADLIGLLAVSDEGEALGEVAEVLQSAANDIYVIRKAGEQDILVPAIQDCVKAVDISGGKIVLHLLPGLREANQK